MVAPLPQPHCVIVGIDVICALSKTPVKIKQQTRAIQIKLARLHLFLEWLEMEITSICEIYVEFLSKWLQM